VCVHPNWNSFLKCFIYKLFFLRNDTVHVIQRGTKGKIRGSRSSGFGCPVRWNGCCCHWLRYQGMLNKCQKVESWILMEAYLHDVRKCILLLSIILDWRPDLIWRQSSLTIAEMSLVSMHCMLVRMHIHVLYPRHTLLRRLPWNVKMNKPIVMLSLCSFLSLWSSEYFPAKLMQ